MKANAASGMNRSIILKTSRLIAVVLCAMAPSLLAFNAGRRHDIVRYSWRTFHRSSSRIVSQPNLVFLIERANDRCLPRSKSPFHTFHKDISSTLTTLSLSSSSSEAQQIQPSLGPSGGINPSAPTSGSSAVRSVRPIIATDTANISEKIQLLSFYRFVPISDPESLRDVLFDKLKTIPGLRGTVYIAKEGINAQFSVPVGDPLQDLLRTFGKKGESDGACVPFDTFEQNPPNMGNIVDGSVPTFDRLIVRTRDYILRDGMLRQGEENENPALDWTDTGVELDAADWDAQLRPLVSSSSTTNAEQRIQLLDCRNSYESEQGTFLASTPLNTQTFSETWSLLDSQVESNSLNPSEPVYIFCTGGIRCVKVGAYLKQKLGFQDVRSLKHGIIGYERWLSREKNSNGDIARDSCTNDDRTLWVGENFLFDKRRFAKGDVDSSIKEM
ncbi:hypothetical protein HJC23_007991 [Cyclotella cryptica]|uniref:Rhodanese domain-containing protein n=1 Tax=Cyclotella cryptica TaxID=29204 RepID=A0ABD3P9P4_9STRA|eukprot:CCRYP_016965-RA/>CCRYP_016965-RA protein AED:0.22 eAED:0.22 QI:0/-1/0/1/-1/1/1/0/442